MARGQLHHPVGHDLRGPATASSRGGAHAAREVAVIRAGDVAAVAQLTERFHRRRRRTGLPDHDDPVARDRADRVGQNAAAGRAEGGRDHRSGCAVLAEGAEGVVAPPTAGMVATAAHPCPRHGLPRRRGSVAIWHLIRRAAIAGTEGTEGEGGAPAARCRRDRRCTRHGAGAGVRRAVPTRQATGRRVPAEGRRGFEDIARVAGRPARDRPPSPDRRGAGAGRPVPPRGRGPCGANTGCQAPSGLDGRRDGTRRPHRGGAVETAQPGVSPGVDCRRRISGADTSARRRVRP